MATTQTPQPVGNPQDNVSGSLQPNRSDLQPLAPSTDLTGQNSLGQQNLPISNQPLKVQTAPTTATSLQAGVPDQSAAAADTSLLPIWFGLGITAVVILAVAFLAMRPQKPAAAEEAAAEAPTVPAPSKKKQKSKAKKKKRRNR